MNVEVGIAQWKRVVVAAAMQQMGEVDKAEDREKRMRAAGPPVGTAEEKSTAKSMPNRGKEKERRGEEEEELEMIRTVVDLMKEEREAVVVGWKGQEKMGLRVIRKRAERVDREME